MKGGDLGEDRAFVYLLWHTREDGPPDFHEDFKLIGVYETEQDAQAAQERMKDKPGFRDNPTGFEISRYKLDQDHWIDGFVDVP